MDLLRLIDSLASSRSVRHWRLAIALNVQQNGILNLPFMGGLRLGSGFDRGMKAKARFR